MTPAFFTTLQTIATLSGAACVVALNKGEWLVAGVTGLLAVLSYLIYEKVPSKIQ